MLSIRFRNEFIKKHVLGILKENNIVFYQKTLIGLSSLSLVDDSLDSQN